MSLDNFTKDLSDDLPSEELDARGVIGYFRPPPAEGIIVGSLHDEVYSMNYPKVGKCIIFNNKNFESHTGLNKRNGTDNDANRLYVVLKKLGFDVIIHTDKKVKEMENILYDVGSSDHTAYACFVCCILSHGELGVLYGSDGKFMTERVFAPFHGDSCPTLAGKPKIFFIQACQGDKLDEGVDVKMTGRKESSDSAGEARAFRIPSRADFLIVYSTVSGFYSWRNTSNGSWFIQSLCRTIEERYRTEDLLSILTVVNRRVAYDFESYVPNDPIMHMKKQVPNVTSTLTRQIRFPAKS